MHRLRVQDPQLKVRQREQVVPVPEQSVLSREQPLGSTTGNFISAPRVPCFSFTAEVGRGNVVISDFLTATAVVFACCESVPCKCPDIKMNHSA